ncbi:hypothetical protein HmCmsJML164_01047 [Escherichia coli]|nr:hypothetical protein HmCmsJML164_01047 [Escherichia coli]
MTHRRRQVRFDLFSCNVQGHPQLQASLSLQGFGRTDTGFHAVIQADFLLIRPKCRRPHVWLRPCILIQTEGSARFEATAETVLAVIALHRRAVTHPGTQLIIKAVVFQHTVHVVAVIIKPGRVQTTTRAVNVTLSSTGMFNAVVAVREESTYR